MDKHFHHMKTLILMRHAKAQHISSDLTDLHRSLVHQGIEDAKQSAKKLIKHELKIDELILSPSTRTIETAQILKEELGDQIKSWSVQERLYASDLNTLLRIVAEASKKTSTLMLVGHNPELDEIAEHFLHTPHHLKTGELILFKFDAQSWNEVAKQKPTKVLFYDEF